MENIGLLAYTFFRKRKTGIERYSHALVESYENMGKQFPRFSSDSASQHSAGPHYFALPDRRRLFLHAFLRKKWEAPNQLRLKGLHLLQPMPLRYRGHMLVTIHDLAPFLTSEAYPSHTPLLYRYTINMLIRQGARFICNSENTRNDFINFFHVKKDRVYKTYLGISRDFTPPSDIHRLSTIIEKYKLPDEYFLFLGSMNKRKNLDTVLISFARITMRFPQLYLVLAGNMQWGGSTIRELARELRLEDKVKFPGYIEEEDLPSVIHCAKSLLYLSKYEGFGFPVLEGMSCGTPVICSPTSSMPELGGDAVLYADPHDPEQIAKAMISLLEKPELARQLREKGLEQAKQFSWKKTATETLTTYGQVFGYET